MVLLERDSELAALREWWQRARAGQGALVLVGGEAGVGKTSLVQAFGRSTAGPASLLWGACSPLMAPPPLEAVREIAPRLGREVEALVCDGAALHLVMQAMVEALAGHSHLVVLDDVQWADEATVDLLRMLVRRIRSTRSMVIGTHREDEIGRDHPLRALFGDVARSPDAFHLHLAPLTRAAVRTLVADRPLDGDEVATLTGGNPFFVHEVLASAGEELPRSIRDAVLARTAGLPPTAHDLLSLLACSPRSVPDVILPALGVDLPALQAIDATGLIDRTGRGLEFRHELCRMAIASVIPPGGEVTLHARVLQALESTGADPAVLAHHAVGAHDAARIVRHAPEAARRAAASGAHREAATFYEAALAHDVLLSDEERAHLLDSLGVELYLIDRLPDAIEACRRAIALHQSRGDTAAAGASHQLLALYEWYSANRDLAEQHAATAVEVLRPTEQRAELGHAYATDAYLALQSCDLDRIDEVLPQAERIAEDTCDPGLHVRLRVIRAGQAILAGHVDAREELLAAAADAFGQDLDEPGSSGYSQLAYLDVEQRRFDAAQDLLEVSLPLTVERDLPICHVWQLGARGRMHLLRGDWDAAVSDAQEVIDSRGAPLGRTWPELVRGLVALRRGDDDARPCLDAAWELAQRYGEPLRVLPAGAALAEQVWLAGSPDTRLDAIEDLVRELRHADGIEWSLGDLAVWFQRLGRPLELAGLAVAEPYARHLDGDPAGAATFWEQVGEPYDRALALVDTGEDVAGFEALDLLDGLGALAVAAKIRHQMRERGVTGVPVGPRRSTRANPAGLTARQLEVLTLLIEGCSNAEIGERLFISPKTVDHHVSAVLRKLRVKSRMEAAHVARSGGIVE